MILYLNPNGTIEAILPSVITQGSNNANVVIFGNAISQYSSLDITFELPNGQKLYYSPLIKNNDYVLNNEIVSVWYKPLNTSITNFAGTLNMSVRVYDSNGGILASYIGSANISKSLKPTLPTIAPQDAQDLISEINQVYAYLQGLYEDLVRTKGENPVVRLQGSKSGNTINFNWSSENNPSLNVNTEYLFILDFSGEIQRDDELTIYYNGANINTSLRFVTPYNIDEGNATIEEFQQVPQSYNQNNNTYTWYARGMAQLNGVNYTILVDIDNLTQERAILDEHTQQISVLDDTTIKFIPQELTEEEQRQARQNIGAGSAMSTEVTVGGERQAVVEFDADPQEQIDNLNNEIKESTAYFRGNFESWGSVPTETSGYQQDLNGSRIPTKNDYIVVQDASDYHSENIYISAGATPNYSINAQGEIVSTSGFSYSAPLMIPDANDKAVILNATSDPASTFRLHAYSQDNVWLGQIAIGSTTATTHTIKVFANLPKNTAYLRLSYISVATNISINTAELIGSWRFKYLGNWLINLKEGWLPEYQINETPLTQSQADALNSGITAELTEQITANKNEIDGIKPRLEDVAYLEDAYGTPENINPFENYYTKSETQNLISNPNLLINGDFRVNQRGQTSYTGAKYSVDRWLTTASDVIVTTNANGVSVKTTSASWFGQNIETTFDKIAGKTFTISAKIDGNIYSATGTIPTIKPTSQTNMINNVVYKGCYLVLTWKTNETINCHIWVNGNTELQIEYIKLEIGSVATPFSPRPYGEELALCQRYYWSLTPQYSYGDICSMSYISAGTKFIGILNLPQEMRISPTFKVLGSPTLTFRSTSISVSALTKEQYQGNQVVLSATVSDTSGLSQGLNYYLRSSANKPTLELDAEIY